MKDNYDHCTSIHDNNGIFLICVDLVLFSFEHQVLAPSIEAANLVNVVANLTTGDGSELTSLIQSGDLSSAVQLATAAIAAVDVVAQTQTENQDELTEKRIAVIFAMGERAVFNTGIGDWSISRI